MDERRWEGNDDVWQGACVK